MRIILPVCVVILLCMDGITSLTEDAGRECDSDSECVPSKDCPNYQEQQDLLRTLTDRASKTKLIQKLRKLICNKRKRGICCPKSKFQECGMPQVPPSNVSIKMSAQSHQPKNYDIYSFSVDCWR